MFDMWNLICGIICGIIYGISEWWESSDDQSVCIARAGSGTVGKD
jgi:hypothetical protein